VAKERRTILMVGAGVLQVPAIARARARGLRVLAVDGNVRAPGFVCADVVAPIDTRDVALVVELARKEQVDAVLTVASDAALAAVALVAQELGLPGPSPATVALATDKAAQWQLFSALGGARRRLISGASVAEVEARVEAGCPDGFPPGRPVVVKPVDGAGGRGSRIVTRAADLREAVEQALLHSLSGRAVVEEFVSGSDHTAEAFLVGGRRLFGVITDKELGPPGLVPREHVVPSGLPAEAQEKVWLLVEALCREVGLQEGPVDVDFKMTAQGPELFEFAPRLGGNELPRLLERATGVDLVDWALNVALGLAVRARRSDVRPVAVRILFSDRAGLVEAELPRAEDVGPRAEVQWDVEPGDSVREVTCSGDRVGYVLAEGRTPAEARQRGREVAAQCEAALRVAS
jgi:biotin carboxylase